MRAPSPGLPIGGGGAERSLPSATVKVSVHVTGGVFGDDLLTAVNGDELTVHEAGEQLVSRQLPARSVARVRQLARQVAELDVVSHAEPAVDGGTTTIEIDDDDARHRTIVVAAGDDPPGVVWDLLDTVEALQQPHRSG